MIIKELIIRKLYGFMDKDIKFRNNISLLVGINGSGKTSVLNIINWILKPNFRELCRIEFESITLKFIFKNEDYVLISRQNNTEITINIENKTRKKKYTQIQADFSIHPKVLTKNEQLKESVIGEYDDLSPEEHEKETWNFLFQQLPKPIVIGLDRNVYTEEGQELMVQTDVQGIRKKTLLKSKSTPLDKVKSLLSKEYNVYKNKVIQLSESLNEKIMLSSFENILTSENIPVLLSESPPSIETIEELRDKVVLFLKENETNKKTKDQHRLDSSIKKVNAYFENLKKILKRKQEGENILYITSITQFQKINDLVIEFKEFEDKKTDIYSSIKTFLDTLNKFFIDSSKEIYFDKESSEIKFSVLNKNETIIDNNRDIKNLSSGEKQILILLTYIKYHKNHVFIIDEPELSLHPKWQTDFLNSVENIMPADSQLILATHSPEIIGEKTSFCNILLPYNTPK